MKKTIKKQIGVVGVDSGQLIVCDPCYLADYYDDEFDNPKAKPTDFCYSNVCKLTLDKEGAGQVNFNAGHEGRAVAFASGFGDGCYPVIAHYKDYGANGVPDMRIKKVEILMIKD